MLGDMRPPALVIHCDWSTSPRKRWASTAAYINGRYLLSRPYNVAGTLNAMRQTVHGCVLAGFDFPIGLPWHYAAKTSFRSFRGALAALGRYSPWANWYDVAETRHEISVHRPFYPMRPGGTRRRDLLEALGVDATDELRRICELGTPTRSAACPLFWTLGGNQVGKAAISGWREVIVPALTQHDALLWPFDGTLSDLVRQDRMVLAETYPAEAYQHVGVFFRHGMSKRRQSDRATFASRLRAWARQRGHAVEDELGALIDDGFGSSTEGEDIFDSFLGLCGMLEVACKHREDGCPSDRRVLDWEGWIFGQQHQTVRPVPRSI